MDGLLPRRHSMVKRTVNHWKGITLLRQVLGRAFWLNHSCQKACDQFITNSKLLELLLERGTGANRALRLVKRDRRNSIVGNVSSHQGLSKESISACVI